MTVIEGEGSSAAVTRAITEWLSDNHPEVSAEVLEGTNRSIRTCSGWSNGRCLPVACTRS